MERLDLNHVWPRPGPQPMRCNPSSSTRNRWGNVQSNSNGWSSCQMNPCWLLLLPLTPASQNWWHVVWDQHAHRCDGHWISPIYIYIYIRYWNWMTLLWSCWSSCNTYHGLSPQLRFKKIQKKIGVHRDRWKATGTTFHVSLPASCCSFAETASAPNFWHSPGVKRLLMVSNSGNWFGDLGAKKNTAWILSKGWTLQIESSLTSLQFNDLIQNVPFFQPPISIVATWAAGSYRVAVSLGHIQRQDKTAATRVLLQH